MLIQLREISTLFLAMTDIASTDVVIKRFWWRNAVLRVTFVNLHSVSSKLCDIKFDNDTRKTGNVQKNQTMKVQKLREKMARQI